MHLLSENQLLYIQSQLNRSAEEGTVASQELTNQVQTAIQARMQRGQHFHQAVNGVIADVGLRLRPDSPFAKTKWYLAAGVAITALIAFLLYLMVSFCPDKQTPVNKAAYRSADAKVAPQSNISIQMYHGTTITYRPINAAARKIPGTP